MNFVYVDFSIRICRIRIFQVILYGHYLLATLFVHNKCSEPTQCFGLQCDVPFFKFVDNLTNTDDSAGKNSFCRMGFYVFPTNHLSY